MSANRVTRARWSAIVALVWAPATGCARSGEGDAAQASVAPMGPDGPIELPTTLASIPPVLGSDAAPTANATTTTVALTTALTTAPATAPATTVTTAATAPHGSTPYVVPVRDIEGASWGTTHSGYPATDIFLDCGAELISPVDGTLLEVRRVDSYDPDADNPATRGGRSISILGDDGVRYYMAHFESIVEPLAVGDTVTAGQSLGTMGRTGRASACHLHFAISPPCPGPEWEVRRGVIWPSPYLDRWRGGEQADPVREVAEWAAANSDACAEAMADPNAGDS